VRLSVFWRIILTSLFIIVVMAGVNLYALFQLRQLTALSANMNSEKKYLVVRDATFLRHFDEEVEEFHRGLQSLEAQELTPKGSQLLNDIKHMHQERLAMLHEKLEKKASSPAPLSGDYEGRRDALMERISATLQELISLHESGISVGVSRSQESSAKAEAVTEQLVLLALVFGITLAGFASYSTIAEPYQTDRAG
jgi:two-component system, NtrC family, sensor histidine kinase GlrK